MACRATSMAVTVLLAWRLTASGFGRTEFAFNLVFWLVLLVREGLDVLGAREIARHRRLVRPLVNHILALRLALASVLLTGLLVVGQLTISEARARSILFLYGLMLLTTAIGLDFAFRGMERMRLVAVSLVLRTVAYAAGVFFLVEDPAHAVRVPVCLVVGELLGIGLIWVLYSREFGIPRPSLHGSRVLGVMLKRGRSVYVIQVSQAVIASIDLLMVGMLSRWAEVGQYSAGHRMVTALLTFGIIFQQVVFPGLARTWRDAPESGRRAMDWLVQVLMLGLVPATIGVTVLSRDLVGVLLDPSYADSGPLLAVMVWRAPLLILAFLYQAALIAANRESIGMRMLVVGAVVSGPVAALARLGTGLMGAAVASVVIAGLLAWAGYRRLAWIGRQPAWHHHLARPLVASLAMVPVCLYTRQWGVAPAILGGATAYTLALGLLGGFRLLERPRAGVSQEVSAVRGPHRVDRTQPSPAGDPTGC